MYDIIHTNICEILGREYLFLGMRLEVGILIVLLSAGEGSVKKASSGISCK